MISHVGSRCVRASSSDARLPLVGVVRMSLFSLDALRSQREDVVSFVHNPRKVFEGLSTFPMSQRRSRPSNDIGFYYDELVLAAARHIDERPWLQTIDGDLQRSIFVGVCMTIHRYYISDVPFLTFRSRPLHAYAQFGLVMSFPSRTSENERIRTARRPRNRRAST